MIDGSVHGMAVMDRMRFADAKSNYGSMHQQTDEERDNPSPYEVERRFRSDWATCRGLAAGAGADSDALVASGLGIV